MSNINQELRDALQNCVEVLDAMGHKDITCVLTAKAMMQSENRDPWNGNQDVIAINEMKHKNPLVSDNDAAIVFHGKWRDSEQRNADLESDCAGFYKEREDLKQRNAELMRQVADLEQETRDIAYINSHTVDAVQEANRVYEKIAELMRLLEGYRNSCDCSPRCSNCKQFDAMKEPK